MACDLKKAFGRLGETLPDVHKGAEDGYVFSADSVVTPRAAMKSDRLVITKGVHAYHSFRTDQLDIHATKETCRHLALLILGVLFSGVDAVEVSLTNAKSHIRRLRVRPMSPPFQGVYTTKPHSFEWFPRQESKHPWANERPEPFAYDLPSFELTNATEMVVGGESAWKKRDTLLGFGNDRACIRLAELLLNASCPSATLDEYALECEVGFRGVAPGSAEATLWLPGSIGSISL